MGDVELSRPPDLGALRGPGPQGKGKTACPKAKTVPRHRTAEASRALPPAARAIARPALPDPQGRCRRVSTAPPSADGPGFLAQESVRKASNTPYPAPAAQP